MEQTCRIEEKRPGMVTHTVEGNSNRILGDTTSTYLREEKPIILIGSECVVPKTDEMEDLEQPRAVMKYVEIDISTPETLHEKTEEMMILANITMLETGKNLDEIAGCNLWIIPYQKIDEHRKGIVKFESRNIGPPEQYPMGVESTKTIENASE
eukprot:TRINITY_DN2810_c0_g1_i1.p2 TRINITY_DN2810_c0_g1~~TRINITY_DN2810_c0_g1_i1.p2  ORF type:complete len:154 (+),score=19.37 TRINITY_DN2810_c0_g1_i1:648-1109(+)